MLNLHTIFDQLTHLLYPVVCTGCGSDYLDKNELLCLRCLARLPKTYFENIPNNPLEKIFTGRIPVAAAHSEFYFSKGRIVQQLMHELKYRQNASIGTYLGEIMGNSILHSSRFVGIDYLVPLPLFPDKEFKRGYNQALVICNGISKTSGIPVHSGNVIRRRATESQTRKHRAERWDNVADSFLVSSPDKLQGKKIMLIDDVVTTGATLEACGQVILEVGASELYLATLAIAGK